MPLRLKTRGIMYGVFDTKVESGYNDDIVFRYHFPKFKHYRDTADALVGRWIVYREPQRNGGRRAYIAVARVVRVEDDVERPDHAYAYVADYLPFDRPVPLAFDGRYAEAPLRAITDPRRVGASLQGKSIRIIAREDFAAIVRRGFDETLAPENAIRLGLDKADDDPVAGSLLTASYEEQERRIEQLLINRKIRDANFRKQVCEAYDSRCAVTGLRIINGGGKAEAQAAHIWPVAAGGPDIVQNGIALSATVHWLFDRHLISLTDDFKLLVSHNKVPAELRTLFSQQMERIYLPLDERLWPQAKYIQRHRDRFASA